MNAPNETEVGSPHDAKNVSREKPSFFGYTLVALGLALVIRFLIAAPFIVSGSSMEHTFENHDYLIVDRITYRFENPVRGDVIVFGLPQETSRDLIKRVIGLPGETVILKNASVTIINKDHPAGFLLKEPYISSGNRDEVTTETVTLGANEYFVLGDNRHVSADSHIWGALPRTDIIGRVFLRLYPFSQINVTPGEARY